MPYRMMREGGAPYSGYVLPEELKDEIKKIPKVSELSPEKIETLLQEIEFSIRWALTQRAIPLTTRSEMLKAISETSELSAKLAKALICLPPQAFPFFRLNTRSLAQQIRLAEKLEIFCKLAANHAKAELSGPGQTPDPGTRAILCYDIACSLHNAGIKVTVTRPKTENNAGGPYWQISKHCFAEAKIAVDDLKKHLLLGKAMLEKCLKISPKPA